MMANHINIQNCTREDFPAICVLYEDARNLQRERNMVVWPSFKDELVLNEIREGRQWKLLEGDRFACNWAITFEDRDIWGDQDRDDSIFIHRICTHPAFRGRRYIDYIVSWVKPYAIEKGRQFIRLDTLGNNTKLIQHYTSAGFEFLGIFHLPDTSRLPKHYQDEPDCCLFQIEL